ncbi:hypothetical protein FNV43_RR15418 [Rhamnella rubrinervis]|uniref:Pentatricopeptide repeat-containing protein n=1 Tax=Rhamnella rubrinervis TaxID=2594499 RepID=A0A8K0GWS2_9ROSA|nr:hypothetical protein FNV43_RR15418 [Rhamnella rubrinervis]
MKITHLNSLMNFCNHFRSSRNLLNLSFYSTTVRPRKPFNLDPLYCKISPMGDPKVSIVPVLDQWIEDGRNVDKAALLYMIKELRNFGRYTHALEISTWMSDKRYYPLNNRDVALRLDLIAKVNGIKQAEKYFNNVPRQLKGFEAYNAFLNCYVHAGLVEKAEAIMQQMKDLGFARSSLSYNVLLKLYYKTGNYEKMDIILHEMEKKGIDPDKFTYGIQISAYVANSDVKGIEEVLTRLEADPAALDWSIYSIAANGYKKAGLVDKALLMLKKSEERILSAEKKSIAFQCILTQYAAIGKKDEVIRLWEVYKNQQNVYNKGYICVLASLLKFDDIESAEKIFEEWESKNLSYDIRIPNFLIAAFCRKGLLEKTETLFNRVIEKGGKADAKTWQYLATVYLHHNQMQMAVEATKEEILLAESWWKPTKNFATCLEYLKGKGDLDRAQEIIRLTADKGLVPADTQERLLNYIKGGESNSEAPHEIFGYAVDGNEETSELLAEDKDGGDSRSLLETNAR